MSQTDQELLAERLRDLFPGRRSRLIEPWEQCAWSQSYKVEWDTRDALYLKGTPRSRAEARITSLLHRCNPDHVPRVLAEDLLADHAWRWFLLEDVGECNHTSISPACAIHAAHCLGRLQKRVSHLAQLAEYLPQCRADGLLEAVTGVIAWALSTASVDMQQELLSFRTKTVHASTYFRSLQQTLAQLPATCIHGDFWSGNIACRDGTTSLIDWGDAQWGVGSVSIVNLLASADGELSGCADEIWGAYARGWDSDLTEAFIRASQVAWLVSNLMVDVEIARCCNGNVDMLPGFIPGLQKLVSLWE